MTKPVATPGFRYLWREYQSGRGMASLLAFRAIEAPRHPRLTGTVWQSFWQSYVSDAQRAGGAR